MTGGSASTVVRRPRHSGPQLFPMQLPGHTVTETLSKYIVLDMGG